VGRRVFVQSDFRGRVPDDWGSWGELGGPVVARSRTTETRRVRVGDAELLLKRYLYPLEVSLKAAPRNTFLGRSRAGREFRMLLAFRRRAGRAVAPAPAALGEERTFRLLRAAFLATEWVPDSAAPNPRRLLETGTAEALGAFVGTFHAAGLIHGSLFGRNLLLTPDGSYRLVDLDRASVVRGLSLQARARDLAFLLTSLTTGVPGLQDRVLEGYAHSAEEPGKVVQTIDRFRAEARRRLAKRLSGLG